MSDQLKDVATIRVIRDEHAWDAIEHQWKSLFARSPYAATPLRFTWLREWWRHYGATYGADQQGLRLITIWRGAELVGVLPLYESILHVSFFGLRRLGFLSTGESEGEETCPDYMNLLCLPGEEATCLRLAQEAVHGMDWDFLELINLRAGSPLLEVPAWTDGPSETASGEGCLIANLQGGFESFLGRLNSKHRKNARRCLRSVSESAGTLEVADGATAAEFFDDLVRLHQKRWNSIGEPGCFAASRFAAFHRAMALEGVPAGNAVLARLRVAGQTLSVVYGFITGTKFDVYQSGVEVGEHGAVPSPGVAAHLLLMGRLGERGVLAYDFLRGASQYKNGLSTDHSELFTIRAWKQTVRGLAHRSCRLLGLRGRVEGGPRSQVA